MTAPVTIRDLMTDPALFGGQFGGESWDAWRALLSGFYGLELSEEELAYWHTLTGREEAPESAHTELWLAIGRRGGKTQEAALVAVFHACFIDYRERLAPGEVATVMAIAADRKQARHLMRYVSGLLHSNPMLERLIVRESTDTIELANRCVIEVGTASFRSVRGYTLAAVVCDEIAFWRSDESANPDAEILAALRPALATLGGPLLCLSSPYSKRGELWRAYQRYYRQPGEVLVAQAASRVMNPELPQRLVDQAMERDRPAALAEYMAEFRNDIDAFIDVEAIERLTRSEPVTLPPQSGTRYRAFVDPAGGGADGFALSIAHREKSGRVVVDLVTERIRQNPAAVVAEYAALLRQYGISEVTGDRYAGAWVSTEFDRCGISYKFSERNRSELYLDCLAMFNSGSVELPPVDKLQRQFQNLERRTSRAGRDTIDHPRGLHDDLANAVAGAAVICGQYRETPRIDFHWAN